MTDFIKVLMWLVAAIVGLVAAAYLVLLGINWNDSPPSDAALRLEKSFRSREPIADEHNGYVYLMGLSVDRMEDPREWGMKRIEWAEALLGNSQAGGAGELPGKESDFESLRSTEVQALREACEQVDEACLAAMDDGGESIAEWLETEAWLLDRYRTLLANPGWLETVTSDVNAPLPSYFPVLEAQKLLFLQAWLSAGRGDANHARTLLDEDMKFWRQTLASSDILLSKMIAVAALTRHLSWGNIILRRLPADIVMEGVPRLWRDPISESERSMLRCLAGEWVFTNNMLKPVRDGASNPLVTDPALEEESTAQRLLWRLLKPFLQFQDMSNRHAELLETVADTLDVPYERYPEAVEQARAILSQATDDAFPPNRLYNLLGDILFAIAVPDVTSYAVRVADLEGVRRAAVLAAKLRSQGIGPGQVEPYLGDAQDRNPYDGKAFRWDEAADAIVFTGLESGERGRHVFLY